MSTLSVETGVKVEMPDGVALSTDVIRPSGTGRYPAIVMRTAYDRTTPASRSLQVDALAMAEAGYAVVVQDVRGRHASSGDFEPFVHEQADGATTVEWTACQPWCNGRVGMAGVSYNAFCQLATAVAAPESLDALVPGLAPFDIRTSWIRIDGVPNMGFHLSWTLGPLLSVDPRTPDPSLLLDARDDPHLAAAAGMAADYLSGTLAAAWMRQWDGTQEPYLDDDRVPHGPAIAAISAPLLIVAGWYDVFARGSLDLAAASDDRSSLVVGPWDHSGLPFGRRAGDLDHGRHAVVSLSVLQREWYDRHLRDYGVEPPRARVFITGTNEWIYDRWPPPSRPLTLYPGSQGRLDDRPAERGVVTLEVSVDDPTPAIGGQVYPWEPVLRSGSFDQRAREARDDVISFTSEPLSRSIRVAGRATAELAMTGETAPQAFVTVVDVHPDGSAWNIAEGVAQASETTESLPIDLGYLGHDFRVGHSIRLDVSGAAWPRFPIVPGHRHLSLPASSLTLPEVTS